MRIRFTGSRSLVEDLILMAVTSTTKGSAPSIEQILRNSPYPRPDGGSDLEVTLYVNGYEVDIGAWAARMQEHVDRAIAEGVADKIKEQIGDRLEPIYRDLEELSSALKERARNIAGLPVEPLEE